jgi:hypothetical protein
MGGIGIKNLEEILETVSVFENDYDYVEIDLGVVRADTGIGLSGTSLTVKDLTGGASVSVKFNAVAKPLVPLAKGEVYALRFGEVYLTNAAQAGATLKLFIGKVS